MYCGQPMNGVVFISYSDIQKRIKRRKRRFKAILFLVILSILIVFLLTTPVFKVKNIIVEGNKTVQANRIIQLSGINVGDNILRMNMTGIKENIMTNPYIETCDISRSLLGDVYITVSERSNAGIIMFNDKFITIDRNGVVIEELDNIDGLSLPFISGLKIKSAVLGKTIELMDHRQLDTIKIIFDSITSNDLSGIIYEVDVKNLISIVIKTINGVTIKMGSIDDFRNKLNIASNIIEKDIAKKGLKGTLDMSFNGNPVFRQE